MDTGLTLEKVPWVDGPVGNFAREDLTPGVFGHHGVFFEVPVKDPLREGFIGHLEIFNRVSFYMDVDFLHFPQETVDE